MLERLDDTPGTTRVEVLRMWAEQAVEKGESLKVFVRRLPRGFPRPERKARGMAVFDPRKVIRWCEAQEQ